MFAKYAALVSSASEGAVTRPPVTTRASGPTPVRAKRAAVAGRAARSAGAKGASAKPRRGGAGRSKVTVRGRRSR